MTKDQELARVREQLAERTMETENLKKALAERDQEAEAFRKELQKNLSAIQQRQKVIESYGHNMRAVLAEQRRLTEQLKSRKRKFVIEDCSESE